MITPSSRVVRKLTESEVISLRTELDLNCGLWMKHPMNSTALDDGRSIVINWVTRINQLYQLQWTFREKFPETWSILETIANGKMFGKVYWHRLDAGVDAKPHVDYYNPYIIDGNIYKRYNIFLDIPRGVDLVFDAKSTAISNTKAMEYTLYDMAANKTHAVYNQSSQTLYVMIIDILNPGVKVYDDLYFLNETKYIGLSRIG